MDYTDDEIRKLLDEATPGPWRGDRNDGTVKYEIRAGGEDNPVTVLSVDHKNATYGFGCSPNEGDRYADNPDADERLCLAAPTLARLLLSARAEHRQAVDDIYTVLDDRDHYRDEAIRLAAELAAVREALDAAGAPLTVERGGSGPDSGDEVETTTADRVRWLAESLARAPTFGSIPPAEHARAVRVAWEVFIRPLYADRGRGPTDADVAEHWAGCVTREKLIATLTRHGTPQPEAERLADGAQETTP